jgi:hypothetical protein
MNLQLFLAITGAMGATLGLITFFFYRRENTLLARIGILMLVFGATLVFWYVLQLARIR